MANEVFRHELKYLISQEQHYIIRNRIRAVMSPDPHAIDGTYLISSMYFDDWANTAYYEKENGVNKRFKYRIRCYNSDSSFISLERKEKLKDKTLKTGCGISYDQYCNFLNRCPSEDSNHSLYFEFSRKIRTGELRPVQIAEYLREPYTYAPGNTRITFDSRLYSASSKCSLFDSLDGRFPVMRDRELIMEVKYDRIFPEIIRELIQIGTVYQTSYSKFYYCRQIGLMV